MKKRGAYSVLIKRPGEEWVRTSVKKDLQSLQAAVGGYLEMIPTMERIVVGHILARVALLCDEDARLKPSLYNTKIYGHHLYGNLMLIGIKNRGTEFCSLPEDFVPEDLHNG